MTIIVICIVSFAVSVLSCLITGVALMSLYLKETSKLLESARRNLEIMEQKIGLFVVVVISNCTGVIFGIASIYSADKDVKEIRDNIKNIRKKSMY